MGLACNTKGDEVRNTYKISVGKSEGKRLFGRPKHRWENIKMDLKAIWVRGCRLHSSGSEQDRVQWRGLENTAMEFWVP